MSLFLTPRVQDANRISKAIILYDGWRNVLELPGNQYFVSGRDGTDVALPQLLQEGAAKRNAVVPENDDGSPWGISVDWDALNDLEAWQLKVETFINVDLKRNSQPGQFAYDGWNNYVPALPKTADQDRRQLSLATIIAETLQPYLDQYAAVNIPATIHPALVAVAAPPSPNLVPATQPVQDYGPATAGATPLSVTAGGTSAASGGGTGTDVSRAGALGAPHSVAPTTSVGIPTAGKIAIAAVVVALVVLLVLRK